MTSLSFYPDPPLGARNISGGTLSGNTATATTGTVTITRQVTPLFVDGSAGLLTWAVEIVASAAITSATFKMSLGAVRPTVTRPASPASAVLSMRGTDEPVTLTIVVVCTPGTTFTISEAVQQDPIWETPITLARPGFGDVSPNGVTPPPASAALPASEALSPARRSPQVRAAQRIGSARPDLLERANALQ